MLVVSKTRYLPTTVNTLVLAKDDYFFYIHRDVYDKAIILNDKYSLQDIQQKIEPLYNSKAIDYYYNHVPSPLHILAPFLGLVVEGLPEDIEILTGAIHVITAATDVKAFIEVNKDLRKTLQFSLYIQEEYEMAWEGFFITAIPYEQRALLSALNTKSPVNNTNTESTTSAKNEEMVTSENIASEKEDSEKEKLRSILDIE